MRKTISEMVDNWNDRRRRGDQSRVARQTGYSVSHVSNMLNGRRRLEPSVARSLDRISSRRTSNYTLAQRHNMPVSRVEREFAR